MLAHGDDAAMPDAPPDDDLLMADANDSPPPVEVLLQCIAKSRARALAGFIAAELACVRLEFEERDYTLPYVSPRGLFAEADGVDDGTEDTRLVEQEELYKSIEGEDGEDGEDQISNLAEMVLSHMAEYFDRMGKTLAAGAMRNAAQVFTRPAHRLPRISHRLKVCASSLGRQRWTL